MQSTSIGSQAPVQQSQPRVSPLHCQVHVDPEPPSGVAVVLHMNRHVVVGFDAPVEPLTYRFLLLADPPTNAPSDLARDNVARRLTLDDAVVDLHRAPV